ncbi:MAG: glycosyltransferase family 1 protein [Candidatus Korobacteraceae bacterium]
MRIHFDHQVFSLQNNGGNSRYHFELMRHLAAIPEIEQELFLGLYQTVLPFPQLAANNVRVVGRPTSLPPGGKRYTINEALNSGFALLRGRFDIYHPTHHRFSRLVRARRMVVTQHDCTQEKFPAEFRYNQRVLSYRKALFAHADAIICISEASRQDLLAFYDVDPSKTRVIHHGFTRLQRSAEACEKLRHQVRRDFMLYVGSRAIYKNFGDLLCAFQRTGLHQEVDLVVLGGGPMSPDHSRLISDLGIADCVIHLDNVADVFLAEAYAAARLFAYPSKSEGFGLPPLEAMAMGCPVLVCNTSALPEICGDAAYYFEPDSLESLMFGLKQGVRAREEHSHSTAVDRMLERYSWEKCAAQTLALYRECL